MRRIIAVVAAACVLVAFGCDEDIQQPGITQLPRDLEAGEQQLIQADNSFGLKLFREIHAEEPDGSNIFISPLSVAMALGMAYNGADGTTQQAMQETLELQGMSLDEVNRSYRSLIDLLANLDPSVHWTLANSIWYREGFPAEQDFLDVNAEFFDAEVTPLDFDDPGAPGTINDWVNDKTNGRIAEIVDVIPPEIVMYLINAIYFKAAWTTQFDPALTHSANFNLKDGSMVQVPMMTHGSEIGLHTYFEPGVLIADLPYGGQAYSMTIVLPDYGRDIDSLIAALDAESWQGWMDGLSANEMQVYLPKFTLEYEIELGDALKALGMSIAFDPVAADFTKIYNGGLGNLFISRVKHKTFVDVNEEGTEAAAVTSVEVGITGMPPTVIVDRPFLFAIRERLSGTIVFMGVIQNPVR
ncbi:MAG TPA: serpin family protein [Gemmatimonadota bacterium]|nr:serpin family protein [Gemmatimonadota bacterium]